MIDLSGLQNLLAFNVAGFNCIDLVIIIIVWFYAEEGFRIGFIRALLDFISFVLSFFLALRFYSSFAHLLALVFPLPIGFGNAISFFLVALFVEIAANIIFHRVLYHYLPRPISPQSFHQYQKIDSWLGIIPGIISSFIIIAFLLTLIVALPISPFLKSLVSSSQTGSRVVGLTESFESKINTIFGSALQETMSYLTIEPQSNESINLHFTVKNGTVDKQAEEEMLVIVNHQRIMRGLPMLNEDDQLVQLARTYANTMFSHGYFSHYDQMGHSPFDRMQTAGINYTAAGENLALAPNTSLAMQGLMNSPGHRANILSPNFHKIGVGVINGGIYGEMYVQEFTN